MKKWLVSFVGICLLLTACGGEKTYKPEKINPEIDVCEICNMSIAQENYATEIITKDEEAYKFDDIVCLFEFWKKEKSVKDKEIAKKYVRDIHSGEWIEMEKAYFVYDADIWTPMSSGVVSFKTKKEAQEYIDKEGKGELYDYKKLLNHSWEWNK